MHVATPTYATCPMLSSRGSSFPAVVQQGVLFLLVCKRIFFPYWCFTGCSFPAGDSQGFLSLLVLHKFPISKFCHGHQTKQAVSEKKTFKNKMVAILDFGSRGHPVATVSFNSIRPKVWEEKSKIGFQDCGYGSHFGFPVGMIIAIFHLHINLLLHCKFKLNLLCDLRDVQNSFSIWRLWWPSWISDQHNFSSCLSRSCPVTTEQISAQIDQRFGKRCRKLNFKMAAVAAMQPSWIFNWLSFKYFVFTRCPNVPHQVSTQLDHSL